MGEPDGSGPVPQSPPRELILSTATTTTKITTRYVEKRLLNLLATPVKLFTNIYKQCLYILQFVKRFYIDILFARKLVRPLQ